jgi:hypothetical protein
MQQPLEELTLAYKMKPGDRLAYDVRMETIKAASADGESQTERTILIMKLTQRVRSTNADGTHEVEMIIDPQKYIKNDQESRLDKMQRKVKLTMAASGQVLKAHPPDMGGMTQSAFPTRPLRLGERWEEARPMELKDPQTGQPVPGASMHFHYHLTGIEQVNGFTCAHIDVRQPETPLELGEGITQKLRTEGATWFAYSEGRLVKSEVETSSHVTVPEGTLTRTDRILMELVPDGPSAPDGGEAEYIIAG